MKSSPLRRIVEGVTATLIALCGVSGYLGLRAVVWRQDYMVAALIQSGIVVSLIVAGGVGVVYVLFGSWAWRVLRIDWLSIQFGALVGALIYGGYNAVTPLVPASRMEFPAWRALQGGVDGLLIGMITGAAVLVISARPLRFDRFGLQRYLMLFVVVALIGGGIVLSESVFHFGDAVGVGIALPLLIVLRLVVSRLDRRYTPAYEDYGYEDGA